MQAGVELGGLLSDFGVNIAGGAFFLVVGVLARNPLLAYFARLWHWARAGKRRYVLIWIDDEGHGQQLADALERRREDAGGRGDLFRSIDTPRALLSYPARRTRAMVLIDTDVTKLADDPGLQRRIGEHVKKFVMAGGGLVGAHDLIYRRVRSRELQLVFGCQINGFERRTSGVRYEVNGDYAEHALRRGLGDEFSLDDGEICWGKWPNNAEAIYETKNQAGKTVPLVVARHFSKGRVVWLNSGDKDDSLCASISKPQDEFVMLLGNALDWAAKPK